MARKMDSKGLKIGRDITQPIKELNEGYNQTKNGVIKQKMKLSTKEKRAHKQTKQK